MLKTDQSIFNYKKIDVFLTIEGDYDLTLLFNLLQ